MKENLNSLLIDLADDPKKFSIQGKANLLVKCLYKGGCETLIPFFTSSDIYVRKTLAFVASELGSEASILVQHISPLTQDPDEHTRWCAIESVFLCAHKEIAGLFIRVLMGLVDENKYIRQLSMRLAARSDLEQLQETLVVLDRDSKRNVHKDEHKRGINALISGRIDEIQGLLEVDKVLSNRYGAIGAGRVLQSHPEILTRAISHQNEDVRVFASEKVNSTS